MAMKSRPRSLPTAARAILARNLGPPIPRSAAAALLELLNLGPGDALRVVLISRDRDRGQDADDHDGRHYASEDDGTGRVRRRRLAVVVLAARARYEPKHQRGERDQRDQAQPTGHVHVV